VSRLQVVGNEPTTPTQGRRCHRWPEYGLGVGANYCSCTNCPPSVPIQHECGCSRVGLGPSGLGVSMSQSCSACGQSSEGIELAWAETWASTGSVAVPVQQDHAYDRQERPTYQQLIAWLERGDQELVYGVLRRRSQCSR